jgi:hypothetical protein
MGQTEFPAHLLHGLHCWTRPNRASWSPSASWWRQLDAVTMQMVRTRGDGGTVGVGQPTAQPRWQHLYEHPHRTTHTLDTVWWREAHRSAWSTVEARSHRRRRSRWREHLRWSAVSCSGTGRIMVVRHRSRHGRTEGHAWGQASYWRGVMVARVARDEMEVAVHPVTFLDMRH